MKFTPEEIARMREIAAKATDRPWLCEHSWEIRRRDTESEYVIGWAESPAITGKHYADIADQIIADRAYMQAAVNTHEAALTVIEQQRAEIARLTNFYKQAMDIANSFYAEYMAQAGSTATDGKYNLPRDVWMAVDRLIQDAHDLVDRKGGAG